ncbi:hypothetical protein E4O03_11055 [Treponema sp. OMZ 792]|uniref:hypothetical protein n=1 Tax=unclassified Treponema TaxID=2638727 RepID=UPI0020A5F5C7|nr:MULTISPECIES: hypothetical protein [unclassified Treponema]UTC74725.1 hypothetical protein E4O03_11055 [Treponema sp. OMZ 792]UTC81119.1 hypothetical protein E4O07_10955 [Treponema sp. OMZ 798]
MNKIVTTTVMVIFTLLVFTADILLITRFFMLIKQRRYNDSAPLWGGLPDLFPKIENRYFKTFLNYITLNIAVYIIGYYFPSKWPGAKALRFSFDVVIEGYRFLIAFIITNLFLAIGRLTRKIKIFQQNTISVKLYYIELIIIPIIVVLSLYFFDSVFKVLTKYYLELPME